MMKHHDRSTRSRAVGSTAVPLQSVLLHRNENTMVHRFSMEWNQLSGGIVLANKVRPGSTESQQRTCSFVLGAWVHERWEGIEDSL